MFEFGGGDAERLKLQKMFVFEQIHSELKVAKLIRNSSSYIKDEDGTEFSPFDFEKKKTILPISSFQFELGTRNFFKISYP